MTASTPAATLADSPGGTAARPPAVAEQWQSLDASLGDNFRRIVAAFGPRPALAGETWSATYDELLAAALRLAAALPPAGGCASPAPPMEPPAPGAPPRAALLLRHDTPLFAAVLGTLLSGHVVVVLNPTDPPARLAQVIADAQPAVLLTESSRRPLADTLASPSLAIVEVDAYLQAPCAPAHAAGSADPAAPIAAAPAPALPFISADRPAFLVYTSGSTGRPKGVIQTHRNILHNIRRHARTMHLTCRDRVVLLSAISGAQGMATTLLTLLNGASLHPFAVMEKGVVGLEPWLADQQITVWVSSASLLRNFVKVLDPQRKLSSLRVLRLGSEAVAPGDFSAFRRHTDDACVFLNTLSSSEAGNITQLTLTHRDAIGPEGLPVGAAVEDIDLLVLDDAGLPVTMGQVGELVVRSRYLSPGYWRRPDLTAERFTDGPDGRRTYRTGDLVRPTPAGLFYVGRRDAQVKVRGYRVELAEVQRALERHPAVECAVVWAQTGASDSTELAACAVPRPGFSVTGESLRSALLETLPSFMVPGGVTVVPALPLNAHGKVDMALLRAQLATPAPAPTASAPPPQDQPATPREQLLVELWRNVFPHTVIGRQADFFALGGDSLTAAVVAARLHAATGVTLHLQAFADHPRLAALAAHIDTHAAATSAGAATPTPITRVSRSEPIPLSYVQERIWRICQAHPATRGYNMTAAYRLTGPLDVPRLQSCLAFLFRRHELLRTTFHDTPAGPVQRIEPAPPLSIPTLDFTTTADPEQEARRFLTRQGAQPIDLARLPLVRLFLARVRPHEHYLLRTSHHMLSDAWSWRVFFNELAVLYTARQAGQPDPFPDTTPLGFADYAAWQRRTLARAGESYQRMVDWWAAHLTPPPPPLQLPFARRRRPWRAPRDSGGLSHHLSPALLARLDALGRATGTTAYMIRLAAFAHLTARLTGRRDLVLGGYATNRTHLETQQMLGDFANLVTLRLTVAPDEPWTQTLQNTRRAVAAAQTYGQIPYDQLQADLAARRPAVPLPEIRAILAMSDRITTLPCGALQISMMDRVRSGRWGFSLSFDTGPGQTQCRVSFDPYVHDPKHVRRFMEQYWQLLEQVAEPQPA